MYCSTPSINVPQKVHPKTYCNYQRDQNHKTLTNFFTISGASVEVMANILTSSQARASTNMRSMYDFIIIYILHTFNFSDSGFWEMILL